MTVPIKAEMTNDIIHRHFLMSELHRTDRSLRCRAKLQMQRRGHQTIDGLWGLYISEEEADEILRADLLEGNRFQESGVRLDTAATQRCPLEFTGSEATHEARPLAKETPQRLDQLTELFGLDDFERQVLLICLLPEVSLEYERLFGYLQNDVTKRRPTIDLLLSLLCSSLAEALRRRRSFSAGAPLIRDGIVHLLEAPDGAAAPFIARFVKLDEGILSYLLGQDDLDPRLAPFAETVSSGFGLSGIVLPVNLQQELQRLVARVKAGNSRPICYLHGPVGAGRRTVAQAICHEADRPLLMVDVGQLLEDATQLTVERAIQLIFREARLRGAATCWHHFGLLLSASTERGRLKRILTEARALDGPTFLTGEDPWEPDGSFQSTFLSLEIASPSAKERQELWTAHLDGSAGSLPEGVLERLAETFRLTPGQIRDAAATACRLALSSHPGSPQPTPADLYLAARLRSHRILNGLAKPVDLRFTWNDIVLPKDQMDRLRDTCAYLRHRSLVYKTWGFERTLPANKGLSMLFAGPAGTGKTMAASIIARELGLQMYKIDLSSVVSKYIGETEKNLESIFQEGENSNAILFFDEADALFGKRSEVSDAHDRYANIEVAYLLQRMEDYSGVVILATNLRRNLDEAFTRRLDFAVDFPLPDEGDRLRIWGKLLLPQAPQAEDVNLAFLAHQFKLSGGSIRNAAVAAAFLAAGEGRGISMRHFLRAIRREHQKMGKLMAEADFGPYLELMKAG